MNSETKKVALIVGCIIFSTFVGFYDRVESKINPAKSVIPKASVMVIPIEGMITAYGTQWEGSVVDIISQQLDQAAEAKMVKAIVLRINSPGGTVGASQEIYNAVLRFKKTSEKPVIVSIMDIGASGAYWIALAGDYIFSHPGSIVGSMGVITQTFDLTGVQKKYGIGTRTYKAGVHKDLLNPWRKPTTDDEYLINKMLTTVHEQFINTIIERRNIRPNRARILADGRIYAGEDALNEKLIDKLGGIYDAIQYAGNLVDVNDPKVIYPNRGLKDWIQTFRATTLSPLINPVMSNPTWIR